MTSTGRDTSRDAAREERGENPSDEDSEQRASEVERLERHHRPSGDDAGLHSDVDASEPTREDPWIPATDEG